MINENDFSKYLKKRNLNSHKGTFGKCLCVVGSYGMAGAAILSLKAALRCGVGLSKCLLPAEIYPIVSAAVPESTFSIYNNLNYLKKLDEELNSASSVLIGCGCGKSELIASAVKLCINKCTCPLVIDADGINVLSHHINWLEKHPNEVILTPHSAEMARLLHSSVQAVQNNREEDSKNFAKKHNVTVILKGHHTIIAEKTGTISINPTGNPGMATGGSGDVLSGMIVSFLAQGLPINIAAKAAVFMHGKAGDIAATKKSQHSLLPTDIIEELPNLFIEYEKN